ncbi:MAG: dimethylargininase [Elusimicrobia bacterium]|nr:dimethylargininase [Elusimicrobiota bacterium]
MPVEQQRAWAEGLANARFLAKPYDTRALKALLEELLPSAAFLALTREVSPAIARCELTHLARTAIDLPRARAQHAAYERALRAAGCDVRRLPADDSMPDAVFIEDAAVVLDELAVIARPGAESRRGEPAEVEKALEGIRPLARVAEPATLDGGDVLVVGRRVFVGLTARTNPEGARALEALLAPHGYAVTGVDVKGCLHLKSAVTAFKDDALLINLSWVDKAPFAGLDLLPVDPSEPSAANVLRVGETVLMPSAYPKTRERLEREWVRPVLVDADELAKAEGAVTCCSLILKR